MKTPKNPFFDVFSPKLNFFPDKIAFFYSWRTFQIQMGDYLVGLRITER